MRQARQENLRVAEEGITLQKESNFLKTEKGGAVFNSPFFVGSILNTLYLIYKSTTMKKTILLFSLIGITFVACGPSKEEAAALEQIKMDSVAKATENNIARQKAIQDSTDAFAANQEELKSQLINLKGELAGEESKLNSTEQFKLLRSADEKAAQIAEQTKIVEELKAQIADIEKQIIQ